MMMSVWRNWNEKEIDLISTDSNPPDFCLASIFPDEYYPVPQALDAGYSCSIGEIIQNQPRWNYGCC